MLKKICPILFDRSTLQAKWKLFTFKIDCNVRDNSKLEISFKKVVSLICLYPLRWHFFTVQWSNWKNWSSVAWMCDSVYWSHCPVCLTLILLSNLIISSFLFNPYHQFVIFIFAGWVCGYYSRFARDENLRRLFYLLVWKAPSWKQ